MAHDDEGVEGIDWDDHGPYLDHWGEAERNLWDSEPNTARDLYDDADEWHELQEAFDAGWLATGMSQEEHEAARETFYDISGVEASSFDWESFREYWEDKDS